MGLPLYKPPIPKPPTRDRFIQMSPMARKVALQHRRRFFEDSEQKDGATLEEMIPFMDELAVHYVATAEDKRPLKRLYDDINLTIEEELKAQNILAWLFYTRVRLRMLEISDELNEMHARTAPPGSRSVFGF